MKVAEFQSANVGSSSFKEPVAQPKHTPIPPRYLIRNGVREALGALGERLSSLPRELSSCKRIPCFGTGPVDNPVGINALVPTRQSDAATTFYVENLSQSGSVDVFGPFKVNSLGVLETQSSPQTLISNSGIDIDAVGYVYDRILYNDSEAGFIPATQLPAGDAGKASVRSRVLAPLMSDFSAYTVRAEASGKDAIAAFMQAAYSASDYRPMMRSTIEALTNSGHLKNAYYYSVESKGQRVSSEGDVLVFVDKQNRAFGFRQGTIF